MVARPSIGPEHAVCLQECWEGQPLPSPSRMRAGVPGNSGHHEKGSSDGRGPAEKGPAVLRGACNLSLQNGDTVQAPPLSPGLSLSP